MTVQRSRLSHRGTAPGLFTFLARWSPMRFMALPTRRQVIEARERVSPHIHLTPIVTCSAVDERAGAKVFFKCEHLQKVGAFKIRGALNTILSLSEEEAARGVATHSSGNHGQAVALAAKLRGVPAWVVMPKGSTKVKLNAVAGYGAEVRLCDDTMKAREEVLEAVVRETGATIIHPYDDNRVIAGQGTAAMELMEQVPDLDTIVIPIGGGGLAAGTCLAVSGQPNAPRVVGSEPKNADDTARSLIAGERIIDPDPDTIADGLRASVGVTNFAVIRSHISEIVTVSEEAIVDAARFVMERAKLLIEPSAAVPVAALFSGQVSGERIGVILTGGNIDVGPLLG